MEISDFFDVRLIEEFRVKPEILKMSKKERVDLLNKVFREEYQGKTVTYEMLEEELFCAITAKTRLRFAVFNKGGSFPGFMAKLNIAADGSLIPLISNCEYLNSSDEEKSDQNDFHNKTQKWHYFGKEIIFENERFFVQIDVRENDRNNYLVYNVSLTRIRDERDRENLLFNKKRRSLNNSELDATDSKDKVSSGDILTQIESDVNSSTEKSGNKLENLISSAEKEKTVRVYDETKHSNKGISR